MNTCRIVKTYPFTRQHFFSLKKLNQSLLRLKLKRIAGSGDVESQFISQAAIQSKKRMKPYPPPSVPLKTHPHFLHANWCIACCNSTVGITVCRVLNTFFYERTGSYNASAINSILTVPSLLYQKPLFSAYTRTLSDHVPLQTIVNVLRIAGMWKINSFLTEYFCLVSSGEVGILILTTTNSALKR